MARPLTVALPPGLDMSSGYTISVTALDATTGNDVSAVVVSDVTFEVQMLSGSAAEAVDPVLLLRGG